MRSNETILQISCSHSKKYPALTAMAPTQSEPPFKLTQLVVLALFVVLTFVAAIRFRPEPLRIR
jgi:hypothetical protein